LGTFCTFSGQLFKLLLLLGETNDNDESVDLHGLASWVLLLFRLSANESANSPFPISCKTHTPFQK